MAMRVPELQQQFRYESPNVPAARLQGMQVQTNADMFGAQSGRQLEKAGYLVQRGADQLGRLYVDYQHTKGTEAFNKFQESVTEDLYGEKGIFNLKGEAAMDAPAKAQALLEAKSKEFAQSNGLAQGFFEDGVGRFRRQLMPQVGRFATEQRNNWMMQTQEARAATSLDMALKNYTDPTAYRNFLVDGLDALQKAGELSGLPPEAIKQRRDTFISKGYSGIATAHIATNNYAAAEGLIKSGAIAGLDAVKLQEHITSKKKADLQFSLTMKHEAERNAAKTWEDNLTMALRKGDMNKATELAVNAPAGLKKEGFAYIDQIAQGKSVVNNEDEVWKWRQKMAEDPQGFVDTWNPTHHLNTMDRATREGFSTAWEKIKGGDKAYQDQVVTDAALLREGYMVMGIKDPSKATGDDLTRMMNFNRRFQEEVDTFASEKKRKPTASEKMGIRDNMLVTAHESGGFMGFGKKKTFAFEAQQSLKIPGVPMSEVPKIQEVLARGGMKVTPENIKRVYDKNKGGM